MSIEKSSVSCTHGKGFNCMDCWPAPKRYRLYGREFAVVAEFPDSDEGTRQANDFMLKHDGVGVLAVSNGRVILASNEDKGIPVDRLVEAA